MLRDAKKKESQRSSAGGCAGSAHIVLRAALPPWGGSLVLEKGGSRFEGVVSARAVGWTDVAALRPLRFRFSASADGGAHDEDEVPLSFEGSAQEAGARISFGYSFRDMPTASAEGWMY